MLILIIPPPRTRCNLHGACGGKASQLVQLSYFFVLQSARSVWRQRIRWRSCAGRKSLQSARSVWRQSIVTPAFSAAAASCNLHGACGGKGQYGRTVAASAALQSARSVWRQRLINCSIYVDFLCCNLHGACGGKAPQIH